MSVEAKKELDQQNAQNKFEESQNNRIKEILMKPSNRRTADEIDEMISMISKINFFKNKQIKDQDMKELVQAFQFEWIPEFHNVVEYGERGEKLYIILKGLVSVRIPNPAIKNWTFQRKYFLELIQWKKAYLDKRIDDAIKERYLVLEKDSPDQHKLKKLLQQNKEKEVREQLSALLAQKMSPNKNFKPFKIQVVRNYKVNRAQTESVFKERNFRKGGITFNF